LYKKATKKQHSNEMIAKKQANSNIAKAEAQTSTLFHTLFVWAI